MIMWVPLEDTWEVKWISFPTQLGGENGELRNRKIPTSWMNGTCKILRKFPSFFCSSHFAEAEFLDAMVQLQGCFCIHFFQLSMMYLVWYPSFLGPPFFWERRSWKSVWNTFVSRKHDGWWGECQGYLQLHMYWSICQVPEVFFQHTLHQTVSLHLKIDAWKIGISFWGFQGALAVSFRDDYMVNMLLSLWPTQSRWTISPTHPTDVDSQV